MSTRQGTLESYFEETCRERAINADLLRAVLREFLKALHETDFKSSYFSDEGGCLPQVYFLLGPEAAFHLVGYMARQGKGHDADAVCTELEYLDSRAKRFGTTTQRWQMEVDAEIADRE